ncbi:hypothetical protein, partial [Serratia marcescens]|uniref:hypothetical protein n=1 Tax=Serratia marcescens TaxID=615 RepID=UPI00195409C2
SIKSSIALAMGSGLAESRIWLLRKAAAGGISQSLYDDYLARARQAVVARGLDLAEMRLTLE